MPKQVAGIAAKYRKQKRKPAAPRKCWADELGDEAKRELEAIRADWWAGKLPGFRTKRELWQRIQTDFDIELRVTTFTSWLERGRQ